MAGLVPAIDAKPSVASPIGVDARDKRGHDAGGQAGRRHRERSEAIQGQPVALGCFVASLLAMAGVAALLAMTGVAALLATSGRCAPRYA